MTSNNDEPRGTTRLLMPGGEVVSRDGERHLELVYKRPLSVMKRPLPPVRWSRCQKAYGTRFSFATLRGHTRSSQSQSTVTKTSLVFFDRQFGSLLNTQIESLAANRYGDGDVNAATFSRRVTQVPHTCCRLFSSLQLQVCLRLSGSIVPRWSHLISVF